MHHLPSINWGKTQHLGSHDSKSMTHIYSRARGRTEESIFKVSSSRHLWIHPHSKPLLMYASSHITESTKIELCNLNDNKQQDNRIIRRYLFEMKHTNKLHIKPITGSCNFHVNITETIWSSSPLHWVSSRWGSCQHRWWCRCFQSQWRRCWPVHKWWVKLIVWPLQQSSVIQCI